MDLDSFSREKEASLTASLHTQHTARASLVKAKILKFARENPRTIAILILEIACLTVIFGVSFAVKKNETISALLPATDCPSCSDCMSYSFPYTVSNNQYLMEVLTPSSSFQQLNSWNYTAVTLNAWFAAEGIPSLSSSDIAMLFGNNSVRSENAYFTLPNGPNDQKIDLATVSSKNFSSAYIALGLNSTSPESSFKLWCAASYAPGSFAQNETLHFDVYKGKITGFISDSMIEAKLVCSHTTCTATCSAYLAGNLINVLYDSASVTSTDIITCTTPTNAFTALGIALSYTLSSFSVIRIFHFLYEFCSL
jgi:hypothetical protein